MSTKKTYQMTDVNSVKTAKRFTVNGKSKTAIFESKHKNGILTFTTVSVAMQEAIEESHYFDSGVIQLTAQEQTTEVADEEIDLKKAKQQNADQQSEIDELKKSLQALKRKTR